MSGIVGDSQSPAIVVSLITHRQATVARLQTSLNGQLKNPKLEVVQGAVAALRPFCAQFYPGGGGGGLAETYCALLVRTPWMHDQSSRQHESNAAGIPSHLRSLFH
jgi:hypothetical protein